MLTFMITILELLILHVLGPGSTFGQRCIRYKEIMLWNRLPGRLKLPSSIPVSKRKVNKEVKVI